MRVGERICVCVAGYPSGGPTWQLLAERAPPGWSVRAFDLPDGAATLADQEAALAAEVAAAPEPIVLVGHSLGAWLVGRVLARSGDRVARAVMIGGFSRLPREITDRHAELVEALKAGQLEGEARRTLVREVTVDPDPPTEPGISLVHRMLSEPSGPDFARMVARGIGTSAPDADVAPYATPALVVHGTKDNSVPLALAEELAARGSNCTLVVIEGAGHFLQLFHVDRVARAVFEGR